MFLVTSEGRAVMGASVHLGRPRAAMILPESALATSDASGRMEVDLGELPATSSLVVACPGYLSVPIAQPQAVLYEVELDRGALLSFECVLETGEPVPDVQLQVARGAVPELPDSGRVLPGADGETMSGAGLRDSSGRADVGGLMDGQYVIHAGHRHLVQVDGPKVATAAKGGGAEVLKLVFCRPVGLVIEVEGGEVLTNDVMAQNCRLAGRSLSLARNYIERFRGAYSDAKRFVAFVGVPGADPAVRPSAVVTIWSTSGHCVSITRDMVPIDDAFKPEKLDLRTTEDRPVPMGGVRVSVAGGESDGGDLLQSVYLRPLRSHSPRIAIPREGGLVALPCGEYVGKSDHPEVQRILLKGVLAVRRNEIHEWIVDIGKAPRRLAWSARLSDGNTFMELVVEVRDAAGRAVYRTIGRRSGEFWLSSDREYQASLRIGPYVCDKRILVAHGPDVSSIDFVLDARK